MHPPVAFNHVWKKFRRGERQDSLRDLFPAIVRGLFKRPHTDELQGINEFWALEDISFEVRPGEALGIIGPNGAGKSTTLKLLTRILRPTRGDCHVRGRVGALIEVAAGFHPDLTGLENIYLQGAIMGMRRAEINTKLEEIVEFAGVGAFVNTPVKRYSSGMNARLGFSIAAHLDPDVMVIDEVLSVGDMQFQERCVQRMEDFKRRGVTIVFVSHNLQAISNLCDKTLLLGRPRGILGPTADVLEQYVRSAESQLPSPTADVAITQVILRDDRHGSITTVEPGQPLKLTATYRIQKDLGPLQFGFIVRRATDGLIVYDESVAQEQFGVARLPIGVEFGLEFEFVAHLTRGQYYAELHVHHPATHAFLARLKPAALWHVNETRTFDGVAYLDVTIRMVDRQDIDPDAVQTPTHGALA